MERNAPHGPTIETARLTLRPLSDADLDAWLDFVGDFEAIRLTHRPDPLLDRVEASNALQQWIAAYDEPIGMYAAVVRESLETAGFVGIIPRELPWGTELELGWLLRPAFWGRGYATEAAREVRPLAPGRVIALIRVENDASANVARKLGMSIEQEIDYRGFRTHVWVTSD